MVGNDTLGRFSKYGGGGIRTHGTLADTLVFKTRALNHSTTPPGVNNIFKLFYYNKRWLYVSKRLNKKSDS